MPLVPYTAEVPVGRWVNRRTGATAPTGATPWRRLEEQLDWGIQVTGTEVVTTLVIIPERRRFPRA